MTKLKEKIAQLFMVGLDDEKVTRDEERLLGEYPFGGFILFQHNLREPKQILALCRSLWRRKSELPPLIGVDQEGGRVHRLPEPFTHFPPPAALGRTNNPDLAYRAGLAAARELSAVGINLNFAPVLDVLSNPANPVIGDRALASDPAVVALLGLALARGLRNGGTIPCGKHFPGHGGASTDSHLELPVVQKSARDLRRLDLVPFLEACRQKIETMMTSHVLYPALDARYPATLSPRVVNGFLREEMAYDGVVFSDDLEMKAISDNYPPEEAARLALEAGADQLLFCHQKRLALSAFDALCRRAEREPKVRERVEEGSGRVRRLKERYLRSFTGLAERDLDDLLERSGHGKIVEEIQGSR